MLTHGFHLTNFLIDKTNFVLFHPPQKNPKHTQLKVCIDQKPIEQKKSIKYLGILIDSNLNWKIQIHNLSKIKKKYRSVIKNVVLCKFEYPHPTLLLSHIPIFVDLWEHCMGKHIEIYFKSNRNLTKKALRMITFSNYYAHTHPLFKKLLIFQLPW